MASKTTTSTKKTTKKKTAEEVPEATPEPKPKSVGGKFQKGREKTGGRKPGSKNKYGNIRDRLKDVIMPYLETDPDNMAKDKNGLAAPTLITDIIKIDDPKDRAEVIAKYLPFVVPKYSSTTITADANRPVDEEQELLDLDAQYTKKELTLTLKEVTIVDNDKTGNTAAPPITDFDPDEEDDFDISELEE